ncbi:MAG: FAD-dependent thymidylate synthase [Chloroflexi bacterium]|nr:FAD-dependent thymidylate synthase [Chloroflexota bacterium]
MHVALIAHTPDPELVVAAAARLSTAPVSALELKEKMGHEQALRLLTHLIASGHLSPFEHVSFTFAIDGISRAASHQLVRHRLASYTQQSQRYVALKTLDYVTPDSIASRSELEAKYREMVDACHALYRQMLEADIPAEDARYILPNAAQTRLVMTMNARELMHAASLRLCLRAQWEIVHLFENLKIEVSLVAPFIAAQLKPKCFHMGYCDERECCGLMPTLADSTNSPQAGSAKSLKEKTESAS